MRHVRYARVWWVGLVVVIGLGVAQAQTPRAPLTGIEQKLGALQTAVGAEHPLVKPGSASKAPCGPSMNTVSIKALDAANASARYRPLADNGPEAKPWM